MNKKITIFIIFIIFYFVFSISNLREGQNVFDDESEMASSFLEKKKDRDKAISRAGGDAAQTLEEKWKEALPEMPPPPGNFSSLKSKKQKKIMKEREKIFEKLYKKKKKKLQEQHKKDEIEMSKDAAKNLKAAKDKLSSLQAMLSKVIGSDTGSGSGTNKKIMVENMGKWRVKPSVIGDLVFSYNGNEVAKISRDGELSSLKCKCGMWDLRDSRIGIKGRNDLNLHTDGWFRALKYDSPEIIAGKHKYADYANGGFAGKELWYGGSIDGKLHRG
jgi:hypothetical protein